MPFTSQHYSRFRRNTQRRIQLERSAGGLLWRLRGFLFGVAALVISRNAAAQVGFKSVGGAFGSFKGVPGLTDRKWGPGVVAQMEFGENPVSLLLEGGYVFIPRVASCCGPSGGFTYDDHGLLAMVGPKIIMGSDQLFHFSFIAAIGAEEYRTSRKGAIPGFNPPPDTWHSQAIGKIGVILARDINQNISVTVSGSEYASLSNAVLGGFHPQPSLMLGLSWHPHR